MLCDHFLSLATEQVSNPLRFLYKGFPEGGTFFYSEGHPCLGWSPFFLQTSICTLMAKREKFFRQPVTHLAYFGTVSLEKFRFSSNVTSFAFIECNLCERLNLCFHQLQMYDRKWCTSVMKRSFYCYVTKLKKFILWLRIILIIDIIDFSKFYINTSQKKIKTFRL